MNAQRTKIQKTVTQTVEVPGIQLTLSQEDANRLYCLTNWHATLAAAYVAKVNKFSSDFPATQAAVDVFLRDLYYALSQAGCVANVKVWEEK